MRGWIRVAAAALAITAAPANASADDSRRDLGAMIDAGVPDGVNASLVYRPASRLRVHLGIGHNSVAPGMRAGVSLRAFDFWLTPAISAEAGHYFDGDARWIGRAASDDPEMELPAALARVGYRYANAHVGLELGARRATFYLQAGASRIWSRIHHAQATVEQESPPEEGEPHPHLHSAPRVRATGPSARLGLIVYF